MDQRIFWFFLILFFHQRVAGENPECCSLNFNDRVSKLESQNSFQKEEISNLKTTVDLLRGRVATLEAESKRTTRHDVFDAIIERAKRPFRLLPAPVSRYSLNDKLFTRNQYAIYHCIIPSSKEQNSVVNYEEEQEFLGPPTSCETLAKLGYTLNGFYLIKGNDRKSNDDKINKIQTVFCQFKQRKILEEKPQQSSINFFLMASIADFIENTRSK